MCIPLSNKPSLAASTVKDRRPAVVRTFQSGLRLAVPIVVLIQGTWWIIRALEAPLRSWAPAAADPPYRCLLGMGLALGLCLALGWIRNARLARRPVEAVRSCPVLASLEAPTAPAVLDTAPALPEAKLSGSLTEIPLDEVCQLIGNSGQTGTLNLDLEGTPARVVFEAGMFVTAEYLEWRGQEAFNAFHACSVGRFEFRPGEASPEPHSTLPVMHLLLEAARQTDETCRWDGLFPEPLIAARS
jgi:uncharacterized protein DUF4388